MLIHLILLMLFTNSVNCPVLYYYIRVGKFEPCGNAPASRILARVA